MSFGEQLTPALGVVNAGASAALNSTFARPDPAQIVTQSIRVNNATTGTTGNITHFIDEILSVPTGADVVVKRICKNVAGTISVVSGIVVHPTPANTSGLGTSVPPANVAFGTIAITADGEVHVRTGTAGSEAWTVIGTQS